MDVLIQYSLGLFNLFLTLLRSPQINHPASANSGWQMKAQGFTETEQRDKINNLQTICFAHTQLGIYSYYSSLLAFVGDDPHHPLELWRIVLDKLLRRGIYILIPMIRFLLCKSHLRLHLVIYLSRSVIPHCLLLNPDRNSKLVLMCGFVLHLLLLSNNLLRRVFKTPTLNFSILKFQDSTDE